MSAQTAPSVGLYVASAIPRMKPPPTHVAADEEKTTHFSYSFTTFKDQNLVHYTKDSVYIYSHHLTALPVSVKIPTSKLILRPASSVISMPSPVHFFSSFLERKDAQMPVPKMSR